MGSTSGLCIITKRADTGSTWPLTNHPGAKYYEQNSRIPPREALRASTAAPPYFVPQKLDVGPDETGAFVDGGVSMANNPTLQLFLVATLNGFPFRWPAGEDRLLIVSLGTGVWRRRDNVDDVAKAKLWDWATQVPSMLMEDANWQTQLLLQYLSRTQTPWPIDGEVGDLTSDLLTSAPALTYLRYNVWLEDHGLRELALTELVPRAESLREMSAGENRYDLATISEKAAERQVREGHFLSTFDLAL